MNGRRPASTPFFRFSDRIDVLPVIHGSADFAVVVRDQLLSERYSCLAVPLPPLFQDQVEDAIRDLPRIRAVVQPRSADDDHYTMVPIDPCQPVICAIDTAIRERIPRVFIDDPSPGYEEISFPAPDPYALKALSPMAYAAAMLSALPAPEPGSFAERRVRHLAFEMHKLELDYDRILFIPGMSEWPWIRDAYMSRRPYPEITPWFGPVESSPVDPESLYFFLSELPFITHLYHRQRLETFDDSSLTIHGVKELLVETRDRLVDDSPESARRVTVQKLRIYLQYVRNFTLMHRRLRPDLATLVEAAKQVFGDSYAIKLVNTAKWYPEQETVRDMPTFRSGPSVIVELPTRGTVRIENRLPGPPVEWRNIQLIPDAPPREKIRWQKSWNPYGQCSWPPEDARIESFNLHVREQARLLITNDLARVEKFTSSLKDGLDIRETLRNWHTGDLFVRELPPARGQIEVVVFLFEVPADPSEFSWRATWFAENEAESTLCFYATNFLDEPVGPGICQARYGGAFFLFPPRPIFEVWKDPSFQFTKTIEERLLAGALFHSREKHVAVVSPVPLKASWRRLARRFSRTLVHIPLSRFSQSLVERLRTFHVLNGKDVRSFAAHFIRRTE